MISRIIDNKIRHSAKSTLLLGPRQTGKSTLLGQLEPDLIINLANEADFLRYSVETNLLTEQIQSNKYELVFVDEIQRIPSLLNTIQFLLDKAKQKKKELRFLLSGSSARKLKKGHANLLPGRVFTYQLSGICAAEVAYEIDITRAMRFGFLPEPFFEKSNPDTQKLLESYGATYLKEEIQAEAISRNLQGFARFLMTAAGVSGQVVDISKLASKSKVSRSSAARFFEILEDTLIAHRIPTYEGAEDADIIKHPKFYFFDVGVLNGLLNNFECSNDRKGLLFEHVVYNQIRNSLIAHDFPIKIEYFRTRHGLEIDFIVQIKNKVWAIEAKSGHITDNDIRSFSEFKSYSSPVDYYAAVGIDEKKRTKGGVLICDLPTLLKEMGL